jgi:NADH:ubiquinone oxidoreductase subunit C
MHRKGGTIVAMTNAVLDQSLLDLRLGEDWRLQNGTWWATLSPQHVPSAAAQLLAIHARFITITAIELVNHELRMDYHWDLKSQIVTLSAIADGKSIASIADICPAADWAEREIHEYFAVEFPGRVDTMPLMLRMGDELGINLHKDETK